MSSLSTAALDELGVSEELLRTWSKRSACRAAAALVTQWLVIAAAMAIAVWTDRVVVYAFAVVVIATRQHALAVLMHEGAHGALFGSRRVNDVVTTLCAAFPLMLSMSRYRERHLEHHLHLNTDRDPDLAAAHIRPTRREWITACALDLTGWSLISTIHRWSILPHVVSRRAWARSRLELASFVTFVGGVAAVITWTGAWAGFFALWIVPMMTVAALLVRVRGIAEHAVCRNDHELNSTRTVVVGILERILIAPLHIHYHLEHHLFPGVPFFRLGDVHRALAQCEVYRDRAQVSHSYLFGSRSVLRELGITR